MPIPANYATHNRISASDHALSQIQEWIIDGTFQPGEKLNDSKLAEALGISRTPVREALQILQTQGFVQMRPGKETLVTPIEDKDISKIFPPLAALQALAAELATPVISQESIELLCNTNIKFAKAVKEGDSFSALKLDEHFHKILVDIVDNSYISSMISTLQAHCRRLYFLKSIVPVATSIGEHEEIILALKSLDKEAAATLMRKNWLRPMEEYYSRR